MPPFYKQHLMIGHMQESWEQNLANKMPVKPSLSPTKAPSKSRNLTYLTVGFDGYMF
jgi:hypothetical protein